MGLFASRASAYGDPELDWWTIETKHFRVHYDRPLEIIARRIASLAETIHERIADALGYKPSELTEIVVTDDTESANGSATALPYNTIRLYVTAPNDLSTIGDYDDWYAELVTHEYTHITHLDKISGLPRIVNAILGKTLAPNQTLPRWITEGIAVVSESYHTTGGRIRSNLFDMYLRADVIEDNIAAIDQFSNDAYRWPQGDLWYLYGSKFLQWITDVYGMNTIRAISADGSSELIPWGINRTVRRATGHTYIELYEGFKDYLHRLYGEQMREVSRRGLRGGARITWHGRNVYYPRFLPPSLRKGDGEELIYFRDDLDARPGLYRIPLAAPREGSRREELVARISGTGSPAFTPGGDLLFESLAPFKNYYSRYDLVRLPRGETSPQGDEPQRKRLTMGQRAQAPDVSPDGKQIVFTVNAKGTIFLEIAGIAGDGSLEPRRDLVPSARFDQAYTPRFSPDGQAVAYSVWTAGGYRDIRIVDVATGRIDQITYDRALDMTPVWAPDGRTLYFSSDRSGIFNIYAYDVEKRSLAQVTNVKTGAFMPAVSSNGKQLVYVGYGSKGFDLYAMALDPTRFLPAPSTSFERPTSEDEGGETHSNKTRYNPLPTLGPRSYALSLAPGVYGPNAITISANGGDVVGLHTLDASITVDPSAPEPTFSLNYTYNRLPVDFDLSFFHNVAPRSMTLSDGALVPYDEHTNGITTGVSYTHQGEFDSHNFGLSFTVASFKGVVPFSANADPSLPVAQAAAPAGNINVLHVGYGYSNVESSLDAAGSVRGFSFSLGLDYASPYTGSDYTVRGVNGSLQGYITMPWPGAHTLALHTAVAVADGDYPHQGIYSVGGYDLANNSLPSTILSGVFNGSFVLRGYPPGAYAGSEYVLENIEYRAPLLKVDHGLSSLPVYLRRIDANAFMDYGGAFDNFDFQAIRLFYHNALIDSPQLHCSVGAELWFGTTLAYVLDTQFRLGYAYGFSAEAIKGGQPYFVASSAF
jgi:hypothetical protein